MQDPITRLGRGITILLALTYPFIPDIFLVNWGRLLIFTPQELIAGGVILCAFVKVLHSGTNLKRLWPLLVIILAVIAITAIPMAGRGFLVLRFSVRTAGLLILALSVAVLYENAGMERVALLVAILFAAVSAAILGIGDVFPWEIAVSISHIFTNSPNFWSLLPRATGPLHHANNLGWLMAIALPLAVSATLFLRGRLREVGALIVGIFWFTALLTYSRNAPMAALVGILFVMMSRPGRNSRYVGVSFAIVLFGFLALMHPGLRARWSQASEPISMMAVDVEPIERIGAADSLRFTVMNLGPLSWESDYEIGYHLFSYQDETQSVPYTLQAADWVSRPVYHKVKPGERLQVTLPFSSELDHGFVTADLKGPGGYLAEDMGFQYLLAYQTDSYMNPLIDSSDRISSIIPLYDQELLQKALDAIYPPEIRDNAPPRTEIWQDALSLVSARPMLGCGAGAMIDFLGYHAHNVYLECLTSYGILGLIVLLGLFAWLGYGLYRRGTVETTALLGILGALMFHGLADYVYWDWSPATLVAMLLGIALAAIYAPGDDVLIHDSETGLQIGKEILRKRIPPKTLPPSENEE